MEPDKIEAAKACNAYHRAWRAAHKDKVREYNNRYWAKKAAEAEKQEAEKNRE